MSLTGEPQLLAAQDIFVPAKDLHVVCLTYSVMLEGEFKLSDEHVDYTWVTVEEAEKLNLDTYLRPVLLSLRTL